MHLRMFREFGELKGHVRLSSILGYSFHVYRLLLVKKKIVKKKIKYQVVFTFFTFVFFLNIFLLLGIDYIACHVKDYIYTFLSLIFFYIR